MGIESTRYYWRTSQHFSDSRMLTIIYLKLRVTVKPTVITIYLHLCYLYHHKYTYLLYMFWTPRYMESHTYYLFKRLSRYVLFYKYQNHNALIIYILWYFIHARLLMNNFTCFSIFSLLLGSSWMPQRRYNANSQQSIYEALVSHINPSINYCFSSKLTN